MKKIMSVVVTILLLTTSNFFISTAYAQENNDKFYGIDLLQKLNIISGDNAELNGKITRAEFIQGVMQMLSIDIPQEKKEKSDYFIDVDSDCNEVAYIDEAYKLGLISGINSEFFGPYLNISQKQATKIILNALDYDFISEAKGGYPSGYMQTAKSYGLLKGITINSDAMLSYNDAYRMIYNALLMGLVEVSYKNDDFNYEIVFDKSILSETYEIYKGIGQVTSTYKTNIYGESTIDEKQVQIERATYYVGETDVNNFLGMRIIYFYKNESNNIRKLISVTSDMKDNQVFLISASDIDPKTTKSTLYYNVDSFERNLKINPDANVVYNNCAYGNAKYLGDNLFKPKTGNITFYDANNDGKYETIFINDYKNYIVDDVDLISNRILLKYGAKFCNKNFIEIVDFNQLVCVYLSDSHGTIGIESVKEWMVLSVAYGTVGDKTVIDVKVSSDTVDGEVNTIFQNKNTQFVNIDDTEYSVCEEYNELTHISDDVLPIKVGYSGTFLLNYNGDICGVKWKNDNALIYGFLIGTLTTGKLDSKSSIKVFSFDKREIVELKTTQKITLVIGDDSNSVRDNAERIFENLALKNKQILIKYSLNADDCVTKIYVSVDKSQQKDYIGYTNNLFSMDYKLGENPDNIRYYFRTMGSRYIATDKTKVLIIPADRNYEEGYQYGTSSIFGSNDKYFYYKDYDVEFYDVYNDYTVGVILQFEKASGAVYKNVDIDLNSVVCVVQKVTKTVLNGEEVFKLYCLRSNREGAYYTVANDLEQFTNNELLSQRYNGTKFADLKSGDMILFDLNTANKISKFQILFRPDDEEKNSTYWESWNQASQIGATDKMAMLHICYGQVIDKGTESLVINANQNGESNEWIKTYLMNSNKNVYLYNKTTQQARIAKMEEISKGSTVVVRSHWNQGKDILIIAHTE